MISAVFFAFNLAPRDGVFPSHSATTAAALGVINVLDALRNGGINGFNVMYINGTISYSVGIITALAHLSNACMNPFLSTLSGSRPEFLGYSKSEIDIGIGETPRVTAHTARY